jgi:hypothetical protein
MPAQVVVTDLILAMRVMTWISSTIQGMTRHCHSIHRMQSRISVVTDPMAIAIAIEIEIKK